MHYMHYMHYKDYIHHDFYVYSPVLLTQYLGHCWHTPCTELYILRISAWLLRKPPSPATGGGEPSGWGRGGVWGSLLTYTYIIYIDTCSINYPIIYSTSDSLTKSFFWYLNQHFSSFLMVTYRQTIIFLGKWLNSTKTQCFFCETQHFRTNLMLKSVKSH